LRTEWLRIEHPAAAAHMLAEPKPLLFASSIAALLLPLTGLC
jgi:hypothetical protein